MQKNNLQIRDTLDALDKTYTTYLDEIDAIRSEAKKIALNLQTLKHKSE